MNASTLTQQHTIINALERGDVAVLDVLSNHDLHDLEHAAECWGAANARRLILVELDNRDPTAQQMVDLIQQAQISTGIRVPLRLQGIEGRYVHPFDGPELVNHVDEKAPTRPVTPFSIIMATHALPPTYSNILEALQERQQHERQERHVLRLGMPARRPTYADRLKAERTRLLKAHGYHLRRDADGYGQHWVSLRGVPLKVRRRLAKLARMIDIAKGRRPECLDAYAFELQCRTPGISSRTLDRWLTAINPV